MPSRRLLAHWRRVLGWVVGAGLAAIGRLSELVPVAYRVDARLSELRFRWWRHRVAHLEGADPTCLGHFEQSTFSQNGEDGIIAELVRRVGTTTPPTFVEIGAADGHENCTRALLELGWTGLWVEADPQRAVEAAVVAGDRAVVLAEPAMAPTICDRLRVSGVPVEPDVLVVDVDGLDLALLRAIVGPFRPRIVVAEYNAALGAVAAWSLGRSASGIWDGTFRHGASLRRIADLLGDRGYTLAGCDRRGVNAFFVRRDLPGAPSSRRVVELYRPAGFSPHPFGHPRSRRAMSPMRPPLAPAELEHVRIGAAHLARQSVPSGAPVGLTVTIDNGTSRALTSGEPDPFHLSLRWYDEDDALVGDVRIPVPVPLAPRRATRLRLVPEAPAPKGRHRLRVTVVWEYVAWRDDIGGPGSCVDLVVDVT